MCITSLFSVCFKLRQRKAELYCSSLKLFKSENITPTKLDSTWNLCGLHCALGESFQEMSYQSRKIVCFPGQDFVVFLTKHFFITPINRLKCLLSDYLVLDTPATFKNTHHKDNTQDLVFMKNIRLILGYTGAFHIGL